MSQNRQLQRREQNRPTEMAIKDLVRKAKFEKQGVVCNFAKGD